MSCYNSAWRRYSSLQQEVKSTSRIRFRERVLPNNAQLPFQPSHLYFIYCLVSLFLIIHLQHFPPSIAVALTVLTHTGQGKTVQIYWLSSFVNELLRDIFHCDDLRFCSLACELLHFIGMCINFLRFTMIFTSGENVHSSFFFPTYRMQYFFWLYSP